MGWFSTLRSALSPAKISATVVKEITGAAKDVTGVAKDVTGIQKDRVETKLAEKKLEESERLIQPATLVDVKEFDPKYKRLRHIEQPPYPADLNSNVLNALLLPIVIILVVLYATNKEGVLAALQAISKFLTDLSMKFEH